LIRLTRFLDEPDGIAHGKGGRYETMQGLKWTVGSLCTSVVFCLLCAAARPALAQALEVDPLVQLWLGLWLICTPIGFVGVASSAVLLLIIGPRVLLERLRQTQ
jgi:hypothetical protein